MKTIPTTEEILAHIRGNQDLLAKKGVSYYNKDNKDNKDNEDNGFAPLVLGRTSSPEAAPQTTTREPLLDGTANLDQSIDQELLDSKPRESDSESGCEGGRVKSQTPRIGIINPAIVPEDVDRCLLTFYDNGEGSRMRYKLAITINPNSNPKERWQFIANLNKDRRIFMRNIPQENSEYVIGFGNTMRETCKRKYRNYPLLGKIHENSRTSGSVNQKEDGCAAAVYWNGTEWLATVMLWEYVIKDIVLTDTILTHKQKSEGVRGVSGVIYGEHSVSKQEWQKRARPTFKSKQGANR